MRIYLLGFMGSGKSSQGKKLASKLGYKFLDTDQMTEKASNAKISEIFRDKGESWFRDMEADVLRATVLYPDAVIACGSGTPCYFNNMQWMFARGVTIYMQQPAERLFGRLKSRKAKRPLIAGMDDDALKNYIIEKLSQRNYLYQKAHHTVDLSEHGVKDIMEMLEQHYGQLR